MDRIRFAKTVFIIATIAALVAAALGLKPVLLVSVLVMVFASLKGRQWFRRKYEVGVRV